MINKYFNRRFKTLKGIKLAISIKRPYDWVRLKLRGEKILSQRYCIFNHSMVAKIEDGRGNILNPDGYTIMNIIWTQSLIDDIKKIKTMDEIELELEELIKDINNDRR